MGRGQDDVEERSNRRRQPSVTAIGIMMKFRGIEEDFDQRMSSLLDRFIVPIHEWAKREGLSQIEAWFCYFLTKISSDRLHSDGCGGGHLRTSLLCPPPPPGDHHKSKRSRR